MTRPVDPLTEGKIVVLLYINPSGSGQVTFQNLSFLSRYVWEATDTGKQEVADPRMGMHHSKTIKYNISLSKDKMMDTTLMEDIKAKITVFHDELFREIREPAFWQLVIKRNGWVVNIRQRENDQYCEVYFVQEYSGDDLFKLKGFLNDPRFLLDLRKLMISEKNYYYIKLENDEFQGYYVITRCFIVSNTVDIVQLDTAIRRVINYGILALEFIETKLRNTHPREETSVQSFSEEDTLYS